MSAVLQLLKFKAMRKQVLKPQLGLILVMSNLMRSKISTSMMVRTVSIAKGTFFFTFVSEDQSNLYRHARHNAQEAIARARLRAEEFDAQAALDRKTNEAIQLAKGRGGQENEPGPSTEESSMEPQLNNDAAIDCMFHLLTIEES